MIRDPPGGPGVKTSSSNAGSDPWSASQDPTCLTATKPEHKPQKQCCKKIFKKRLKNRKTL